MKTNLTQWQKRVLLVKQIYSQLMRNDNPLVAKKEFASYFYNIDANFIKVFEYFLDYKEAIIQEISKSILPNWSFDRLSVVDQAILFQSYSEFKTLNVSKIIIIDQAIITVKKYSVYENYKYINAILEKVL